MMETVSIGVLTHLRAGGTSLVLDSRRGRGPSVVHWGADLGPLTDAEIAALELVSRAPVGDSRIDVPEQIGLLPNAAEGWIGQPALSGSRAGESFSADWTLVGETALPGSETIAAGVRFELVDTVARLTVAVEVELAHSGLVRVRATLVNDAEDGYDLAGIVMALPVPGEATELLDLAGRHARERVPQRTDFTVGTRRRDSRQGRPGLDAAYLLVAGQRGFSFESGRVWGIHLGWSGNQSVYAEHTYHGHRLLGGGELLLPGELTLAAGESYTTPWLYASHGTGLNELSGRFHEYLRARPQHPATPRPVVLNTWEAVYFDQDLDTLLDLARAGAAAGAERFVLDDGWFLHRRNDHAGLGDWEVDPTVWPQGLGPLIDGVQNLGLEFGLWVEPEMVNLDSDLAREHPEWLFRAGGRTGIPSRQQYVLDLGHEGAYAYIAGRLHSLLDEYKIAYLKWDHNRMVLEAGHGAAGRPGVHRHTRAVYRLLDELRERHPWLEIESCAGGGGRIDLGILEHTDRVWASDCIDPLERQQIQRYTQLLIPPELMGSHIGAPIAHTTHRTANLGLRAGTALWGHMGVEWNLDQASPADQATVGEWIALHKQLRPLLHSGTVVVADHHDNAIWVNGVVAQDGREAVYGLVTTDRSVTWPPGRVRLPGLRPDLMYHVAPLAPADVYHEATRVPEWWTTGCRLPGRLLTQVGVQIPAMFPEYLHLLRVSSLT